MQPERFSKLDLSPEEMRTLGYQVIDHLVAHYSGLPEKRVARIGSRSDLEARLRGPFPEEPTPANEAFQHAVSEIFSQMMFTNHPRFLAFVPSPSNFASVMADALVAGYNPFAGTWMEASGPAQIELVVVDWLKAQFGLPEEAGGLFVSGGSVANMTALAVARKKQLGEAYQRGVVYFSDQTHSSVVRGLQVLGFGPHQIRILESDPQFRLRPGDLLEGIRSDRNSGLQPFCVVANAGTTNTGVVDPLEDLAAICRRESLWLHVDGAYGAAGILHPAGAAALRGIEKVDSLVIDPHKWLFQPYESGCVLVRNQANLWETFHIHPEYLQDLAPGEEEINYSEYGIQLTRSFRAFKLWFSLQVFGLRAFREAIGRGIELADWVQELILDSDHLKVVTPAQLGVITFRYHHPDERQARLDQINQEIVARMIADGYAMVHSTILKDLTVLRMCTLNPRTTREELEQIVKMLAQYGQAAMDET